MKKKYFVYSYEALYQGLDGAFYQAVVECRTLEEAEEIGYDLSLSVIGDFCFADYEEDADLELGVRFMVYEIQQKYQNMAVEDLNQAASSMEYIDFVKEFCEV